MTTTQLLSNTLKSWEEKMDAIQLKQAFCREHGFLLEAQSLQKQAELLNDVLRDIRLRVVEKVIK